LPGRGAINHTYPGRIIMILDIIYRIIAVFIATALATIGTGSLVGVSIAQSALMAGAGAVAAVIERLARAFMDDGRLTMEEVNAAFNVKDPKKTADGLGEGAEASVAIDGIDDAEHEPYQ
jgi:hypothetical protein